MLYFFLNLKGYSYLRQRGIPISLWHTHRWNLHLSREWGSTYPLSSLLPWPEGTEKWQRMCDSLILWEFSQISVLGYVKNSHWSEQRKSHICGQLCVCCYCSTIEDRGNGTPVLDICMGLRGGTWSYQTFISYPVHMPTMSKMGIPL